MSPNKNVPSPFKKIPLPAVALFGGVEPRAITPLLEDDTINFGVVKLKSPVTIFKLSSLPYAND